MTLIMYAKVIRGLLSLSLLMPLFHTTPPPPPPQPPSVDAGLWCKRPIKGSVTHLPAHTLTLGKKKKREGDTHTFFSPNLILLSVSRRHSHTHKNTGLNLPPSHRSTCSHQNLILRYSVSALLLSTCHSFTYNSALASEKNIHFPPVGMLGFPYRLKPAQGRSPSMLWFILLYV